MSKLSWKWVVLVGSVFSLLFYLAVTSKAYLAMRQMSLGEPDPWFFIILGVGLVFAGWYMFVMVGQNISTEIATEVGGFSVHSMDPVAVIDPLEYYDAPGYVKDNIRERIKDSWKYKDYLSKEVIDAMCISEDWKPDGPEIRHYLVNYQAAIDAMKPVGIYPDGGIKLIGMHGFRWWIGGTALLAVNPELIIQHGDGGVCVSAVKNYSDIEQLQALPPWLQRGLVDSFPQFQPGKHIITFGNRPHPKAVRAMVRANEDAPDDELNKHPKWIWTLPLRIKNIEIDARKKMLKDYDAALTKELNTNRKSYEIWKQRKPAEQKIIESTEEEEDENNEP